jgi:hypothetical protein
MRERCSTEDVSEHLKWTPSNWDGILRTAYTVMAILPHPRHGCFTATPYFRRISIVRPIGNASTVCPRAVVVVAMNSEL